MDIKPCNILMSEGIIETLEDAIEIPELVKLLIENEI